MTTLELRDSSRGSCPWKHSYFTVRVLAWLPGWDSSPRIPTSTACPSILFPSWVWKRKKAGRAHLVLMFLVAPPSRLRELSLKVLRCVFTSQIFLNGLVSIWQGDRHGSSWDEWDRLGVCTQGAYDSVKKTQWTNCWKGDELWKQASKGG